MPDPISPTDWTPLLERDLFTARLKELIFNESYSAWSGPMMAPAIGSSVEKALVDCGRLFYRLISERGVAPEDDNGNRLPPDGPYRAAVTALDELSRWLLMEGNPDQVHELIWHVNDQPAEGFWLDKGAELGYCLRQLLREFIDVELPEEEELKQWQVQRYAQLCNLEEKLGRKEANRDEVPPPIWPGEPEPRD